MAKIKFTGFESFAESLQALEGHSIEACKFAVYPAAGLVAKAIYEATPKNTGGLANSLGIAPIQNKEGVVGTKITFDGYNEKHVAYSYIARSIVKGRKAADGTDITKPNPFIRKAVNKVKKQAVQTMQDALNEYVNKITKEG